MRKLIALFILGLAVGAASAQSTTFSATITDSDGTPWASGSWTASIYSPLGIPFFNGAPLSPTVYSGTMNSSGVISVTLPSNTAIAPVGSQWRFLICPNASAGCSSVLITVTGASQDGSATLSAGIIAPKFSAGPYAYGYTDGEVSPTPLPGGVYFNTATQLQRIWNGVNWSNQGGGGGGGGVTSINSTPGAFTFTGGGVSCTTTTCTFSGGGGGGAVSSVFGRTGAVVAATNDYNFNQLAGTIGNAQFGATVVPNNGHITLDTVNGIIEAQNSGSGEVISDQFYTGTGSTITAFGTAAAVNTGTSGATIPLLNTANTWSALQTFSAALSATTVSTTSGCPGGTGGCLQINEGSAVTGVSSVDILWANSSTHRLNQTDNNGTAAQIVNAGVDVNTSDQVTATHLASALPVAQGGTGLTTAVANVTVTLPTTAIASATCTSVTTATMTNLTTSMAFTTAFATDPSAVTGWGAAGGLTWVAWPTANTLNWKVCNVTGSSITPGAMTLNVGAR